MSAEFPHKRLGGLFDETRDSRRAARPTVVHRQIPPHELGGLRIAERRRVRDPDQMVIPSQFLEGLGPKAAEISASQSAKTSEMRISQMAGGVGVSGVSNMRRARGVADRPDSGNTHSVPIAPGRLEENFGKNRNPG